MIALRQVMQARDRIFRSIIRTPAVKSDFLSDITGANVYLKLECLQKRTRSRSGALNRGLTLSERAVCRNRRRLIRQSRSGGGMWRTCWDRSGCFVPRGTPEVKLDKIRRYGAVLHLGKQLTKQCVGCLAC